MGKNPGYVVTSFPFCSQIFQLQASVISTVELFLVMAVLLSLEDRSRQYRFLVLISSYLWYTWLFLVNQFSHCKVILFHWE